MLDAAGLHRRCPHQMRHTFAGRLEFDYRIALSGLNVVVSRVGIEPTTRRLRERLASVHRYPFSAFSSENLRPRFQAVRRFPLVAVR